jgi:hypothetical protein
VVNIMINKQRSDERVNFITKCRLDINGTIYDGLVDNISTTGASIEMTDSGQIDIHVGDMGTLKVLLLSPVKYLCKVVRINSNQIGLQFIEQ